MKVGIIGTGNVGTGIAKHLVRRGHVVTLSFSKDVTELVTIARSIDVQSGTPADASRFADVVVLAVPWGLMQEALHQAEPLRGKIIWDCTNPLKADLSGLELGTTTSAGEEVARMAPTAIIVKAIPPFAVCEPWRNLRKSRAYPPAFRGGRSASPARSERDRREDCAERIVCRTMTATACQTRPMRFRLSDGRRGQRWR
jgi:hypothetical protein